MRYLKALGLAALMALAASAMFASAAQAQAGTLTAGETPDKHEAADITTEQYPDPPEAEEEWNFFAATPGAAEEEKIRCDTANLKSTTPGTSTQLTVEPEYIHCSAAGRPVTVFMNGCDYTLTQPTTIAEDEYTGKTDLTCPEGKRIEAKVYLFGNATNTTDSFQVCKIEIWPNAEPEGEPPHETQELGGHVIYKNIAGEPHDITAAVAAEGITSHDGCNSGETHTNGIYKQTLTIKAFEDGSAHEAEDQINLWLSE